jgi:EAL domain-containing protein (putative c-di-GMP-specific phosphodiesterase class I)
MLYPDQCIGRAEEKGLIAALTDFVLQEGIGQIAAWDRQGVPLHLAVNLSPRLVRELDFPERLAAIMRDLGLHPARLTLEVTETAALEDPARTIARGLHRRRRDGGGTAVARGRGFRLRTGLPRRSADARGRDPGGRDPPAGRHRLKMGSDSL